MNGHWDQAETALNTLKPIMDDSNADITNMKFLILEQKYLECLEDGKILEALKCLRDELAPLKYNIDRLHELSSFLMCTDQLNLKTLSKWAGKSATSRQTLMDKLQSYLPPHVMLPPRRLEALLTQAIDYQCDKCPYHNVKDKGQIESWSFLRDHVCTKDDFPSVTLQIINDHCDEVWICKFSNNGKKLATGSKDGCLFIWDVDPVTYRLTLNKCYEDHTCGVGWVTWSPDDRYIIACGTEESTELWIWDIENKVLKKRLNNNHDDSLTCAAWLPDGQTFVTGGAKGQFYYCDLDGNIRDTWEGIRVKFLQTLPDGLVLAADSLKRIRSYNFKEISDANLVQEDFQIMSFTLNKSANLILISLANQGLHLWDAKDRVLVHRYQGAIQNSFMSYGSFGGIDENFIASGSEDTRVYIWNKRNEQAICILEGHTRNVSCVSWNPVYVGMIASSSDDGTVRIWGPKNKQAMSGTTTNTNVNGTSVETDLNDHSDNLSDNVNTSANNTNSNSNTNNTMNNNNQIGNNIIGSTQLHNLVHTSSFSVSQPPTFSTVPQQYTSSASVNRSDRSTPV